MVQIPRVPSRGSARTLPKTASYIFLLSMTSRRGGARTQTLAKDSARASLLKNRTSLITPDFLGRSHNGSAPAARVPPHHARAMLSRDETRAAERATGASQSERFALELEFVMSLANPRYVHRASPTPRTSVHSFRI